VESKIEQGELVIENLEITTKGIARIHNYLLTVENPQEEALIPGMEYKKNTFESLTQQGEFYN
jgi:hypothetical protein